MCVRVCVCVVFVVCVCVCVCVCECLFVVFCHHAHTCIVVGFAKK